MHKPHKKWSRLKKITVTSTVIISLIGISSASYGAYLFFKQNTQSTKLTPALVEQYTAYNKADSNLVSTLKANALSVHLATGDDTLIRELHDTLDTLTSLNKGTLPENEVEPLLSKIKTKYTIPTYQIDDIRTSYYTAALNNHNSEFKKGLETLDATQIQTLKSLAESTHHFATKLSDNYAKDVNMDYPQGLTVSIELLESFKNKIDRMILLNDLFIKPETTLQSSLDNFGPLDTFTKPFSTQFSKLNQYVKLRDEVATQTQDLQNFKSRVEESKRLQQNSVELKDFTDMTVKEVKDWAGKNGIYIAFEPGTEQKDTSLVISQSPAKYMYDRILKGTTLTIETPKIPEKPKPSSTSPSSSSSSSSQSESQPSTQPSSSTSTTESSESGTPIIPPSSSSNDKDDDTVVIESTTERKP